MHPRSLRAPATRAAFERALGDLRYGTIVVNAPTFIGFTLPAAPWGAYPGHTDDDIRSGRGVVHNGMLLGPTEKTVVRAPFRSPLKPVWWPDHRRADEVMRGMTNFEAQPRLRKLPAIVRGSIMG